MLFFDLFRHDPEFIEVKHGEVLFRRGDIGEAMYVLIEGEAEIMIDDISFEKCTQGAFMGEMAVIDGSPRYATVIARTDCKFAVINKRRFHFLMDETPGFAVNVLRVMAHRLKKCDLRVIQAVADSRNQ